MIPDLGTKSLLVFYSADGITQEDLQALTWQGVTAGLRPLLVWMSNSLELLHVLQFQLPLMLECKTQNEKPCNAEERRDNEMENLS